VTHAVGERICFLLQYCTRNLEAEVDGVPYPLVSLNHVHMRRVLSEGGWVPESVCTGLC
jgi:hypothetical protein